MLRRFIVFLAFVAVAAGLACGGPSDAERQDKLVRAFIAILPDSLSSEHKLEIEQLFHMFYLRAARGEVPAADVERITGDLARHVDRGRITSSELVRFMADVGYTTYKGDPRYNLPDSSVDHPILNPQSALYSLRFNPEEYDSAFWADFDKWRKEHEGMTDSMLIEELLRTPVPERQP